MKIQINTQQKISTSSSSTSKTSAKEIKTFKEVSSNQTFHENQSNHMRSLGDTLKSSADLKEKDKKSIVNKFKSMIRKLFGKKQAAENDEITTSFSTKEHQIPSSPPPPPSAKKKYKAPLPPAAQNKVMTPLSNEKHPVQPPPPPPPPSAKKKYKAPLPPAAQNKVMTPLSNKKHPVQPPPPSAKKKYKAPLPPAAQNKVMTPLSNKKHPVQPPPPSAKKKYKAPLPPAAQNKVMTPLSNKKHPVQPPPPPPHPPPPSATQAPHPPSPTPPPGNKASAKAMDSRERLMEDIQKGKKLKPISQREGSADTKSAKAPALMDLMKQQMTKRRAQMGEDQDSVSDQHKTEESNKYQASPQFPSPSPSGDKASAKAMDSRKGLMEDIQKGKKLKPISQREGSVDTKSAKAPTLKNSMEQAMAKRRVQMGEDQDEEDQE